MRNVALLLAIALFPACSDSTSTVGDSRSDPDSGTGGSAGSDSTGGAAGAAGSVSVTEDDLDRCSADAECIVVPYSHCCGATKRAINALWLEEYNAHAEWQVFDDPATCAVIGACLSDSGVTEATCPEAPNGRCQLVYP